MGKICQNCGKTVMQGSKVARARQELTYRAPKVFKPNLHTARIMQPDGSKIKMTLCTKCLRMLKQYSAKMMADQAVASKEVKSK